MYGEGLSCCIASRMYRIEVIQIMVSHECWILMQIMRSEVSTPISATISIKSKLSKLQATASKVKLRQDTK